MRFIKTASGFGCRASEKHPIYRALGVGEARSLIKLPSLPVRACFRLERFLTRRLGLFLSGLEYALLAAADTLVSVEAFQNEFGGRNLLLRAFFLGHAQRPEFVDQALNLFQVFERLQ